ncbi:MAG: discoidin domain-containing protein [Thermoguttaceae bacterium]
MNKIFAVILAFSLFHAHYTSLQVALVAAESAVCVEQVGQVEYAVELQNDWLTQARLRFVSKNGSTEQSVSCEEDASGAVDGVMDGKWGFHTECEPNPSWTVDLGELVSIAKIRLYNRCDSFGERNCSLIAQTSEDGKVFTEVWKNDGTLFYGATDAKPLEVDFSVQPDQSAQPLQARFLRLTLAETAYLHLDEVEVYACEDLTKNMALGKTATQSSTSQWSTRPSSTPFDSNPDSSFFLNVIPTVLQSGRLLAQDLKMKGVDTSVAEKVFAEIERAEPNQETYFRLRGAIRTLALSNPLLDFQALLFAKHAPGIFPHVSDQYYCWWSRGKGSLSLLRSTGNWNAALQVENLTENWPNGTFFRPDMSFDGRTVLFAYARYYPELADVTDKTNKDTIPEEAFFHLFEMDIATRKFRQLTFGKYDDFDARYLPDGEIVFLSTRKGQHLQTGCFDAAPMSKADLPNSYVRCGGDNYRPVPVFTLHTLNSDQTEIRQISAFENFEWTPSVLNDGRIAYARWDYIDRYNGHFFSLWSTNPNGTKAQLLYGNYTVRPQVTYEPAPIPNSSKVMFVASAHHSNFGGSLVLLDRNKGTEFEEPLERITPEVVFPETEGWPLHYYANPYPLSENYYLVSWSNRPLPPHCRVSNETENPSNSMGVYYYDRFGNLELLYRDADISSMNPIPIAKRAIPPVLPSDVDWHGPQEGEFLIQDVYDGLRPFGFTPESKAVHRLRIIGTVPKVQPQMNTPFLGVSSEETGKFVLGTVPVEPDGSAYFRVPSGIPYFFQVLDEQGTAIQTMRSLAYLMPGEQATCIGCHENRERTPIAQSPQALLRGPSKIRLDPPGSFPLSFTELVQPVLDARCISCHSPRSREPHAARLDLTRRRAYQSLLSFAEEDLKKQALERDRSIPGETTAMRSRLLEILSDPSLIAAHAEEAKKQTFGLLKSEEQYRFVLWMDLYAQMTGSFSAEQEGALRAFRASLAPLLE